jgi:hypothetical protein
MHTGVQEDDIQHVQEIVDVTELRYLVVPNAPAKANVKTKKVDLGSLKTNAGQDGSGGWLPTFRL